MTKKTGPRIALVGTDTFRGRELKALLDRENLFPGEIEFFDDDVTGEFSKLTDFRGEPRVIHALTDHALAGFDLVFFAAGEKTNRKYLRLASKLEFRGIDLDHSFPKDKKIPIVVAGINDRDAVSAASAVVSNPHSAAVTLAHIFSALQNRFGIKKGLSFILQPASAFEDTGIEELANQSVDMLSSASLSKKTFKAQLAFNVLSQTQAVDKTGFSDTERLIDRDLRRIMGDRMFPFSLSLVQVPVFHSYSIMIHVELDEDIETGEIEAVFKECGIFKYFKPSEACPASVIEAAGKTEIHIGQLKKEETIPGSFWIWAVSDNLIRGAVLNAVETAAVILAQNPGRE